MANLKLTDYLLLGKMGFTRKEVSELLKEEATNDQEVVSNETLTLSDEVKGLITELQNDINAIKGEVQRQNIQNDVVPEKRDSAVDILGSIINPKQNGE